MRDAVLIVLANQYPFPGGDSVFLSNELEMLSQHFRKVFVFSYADGDKSDLVAMPPNVEYKGTLSSTNKTPSKQVLQGRKKLLFTVSAWNSLWEKPLTRSVRGLKRVWNTNLEKSLVAESGATKVRDFVSQLSGSKVVIYSFWGADCGYAMARLSNVGDIRMTRLHRYDLYQFRPFRKEVFNNSDLILPVSWDGKKYLETKHNPKWISNKVYLSRLGTLDYGSGPQPDGKEPVRVVSCSFLSPVKRVQLIHEVLGKVSETVPIEWVHFGDGMERDSLEKLVFEGKKFFPNLKVVLNGSIENADLMKYYRTTPVNVFINLSSSEGVPVSIMEAMSFGIPVVATDVGGTSEVVSAKLGSGELVGSTDDANVVAETTLRVIKNRGEYCSRDVWEKLASARENANYLADMIEQRLVSSN